MADTIRWVRIRNVDHLTAGGTTLCGKTVGPQAVFSNRGYNRCGGCFSRDPQVAATIEAIVEYLERVRPVFRSSALIVGGNVGARFFDGVEPLVHTDLLYTDSAIVPAGVHPSSVRWPMDVRTLVVTRDADDPENPESWLLGRTRGVPAKDLRGRTKMVLPYPVERTAAWPSNGLLIRDYFGYTGSRWELVSARRADDPTRSYDARQRESDTIDVAVGTWSIRPRQWRVYLAVDDAPGIDLPTDPVGARALFRLRDIPEGQARRAALRHWVSEHWRQNRDDPAEEIKVREHLRGATEFRWSGLRCKITPSENDLERAEVARADRDIDRMIGNDRRERNEGRGMVERKPHEWRREAWRRA